MPETEPTILESRNPEEILRGLTDKTDPIDPKKLSDIDRLAVTAYLHYEAGFSNNKIAKLLKSYPQVVGDDLRTIRLANADIFCNNDIKVFAGNLVKWAEVLTLKCLVDKEWRDAWAIQRELIDKLQDLGVIFKAPERLEITTIQEVMQFANALRLSAPVNNVLAGKS